MEIRMNFITNDGKPLLKEGLTRTRAIANMQLEMNKEPGYQQTHTFRIHRGISEKTTPTIEILVSKSETSSLCDHEGNLLYPSADGKIWAPNIFQCKGDGKGFVMVIEFTCERKDRTGYIYEFLQGAGRPNDISGEAAFLKTAIEAAAKRAEQSPSQQ